MAGGPGRRGAGGVRVSVAAEVRMTANVFPLKSVGEPLKNTGNQPGAYFVGCGRFMEMSLGCIGCPNCGGCNHHPPPRLQ